MHGMILNSLGKFVQTRHGKPAWEQLLAMAGRPGAVYTPTQAYPDSDAAAIVAAAEKLTGQPAYDILDSFGEFLAPKLLAMYESMFDPRWKTLDLVQNIEGTIHSLVRMKNPGAAPPHLRCRRSAPDEVTVTYASERRMCGVAVGIIRGIAIHFGEQVEISQPRCMHRGDAHCEIVALRL